MILGRVHPDRRKRQGTCGSLQHTCGASGNGQPQQRNAQPHPNLKTHSDKTRPTLKRASRLGGRLSVLAATCSQCVCLVVFSSKQPPPLHKEGQRRSHQAAAIEVLPARSRGGGLRFQAAAGPAVGMR